MTQYLYTVEVRGEADEIDGKGHKHLVTTWTPHEVVGSNMSEVLTALKLDHLDQIRYKSKVKL